ncbi:HAMP domain-containing histidine kinase [Patescibacteria group bacterium]|nr:MAG: HAMP domain-containing histidine kinase [Patescibacteria group bacterium]
MTEPRHLTRIVQSATLRLAGTYLAIIMLLSLAFSVVFYNTSARQLDRQASSQLNEVYRQIDPNNVGRVSQELERYLNARAAEGRAELLAKLILLNLVALVGGSALSYVLARRSLQPIEEAMDAQTRFVSDASHELRTPLTALQLTNEVALRKPRLTSKESRELIEHNLAEATKLKTLSDGLLGLLKQDGHLLEHTSVSLQAVVGEAMNRIAPTAIEKRISVHDSVPNIMVKSEEAALVQIVTILLDNAVKYSALKSDIYLESKARAKTAYLSVRDNGVGIKASELPHIFDRFYRADTSRSRQHTEGYGLGLSIARKLADQLGAEITAKSEPDKGSTFTIRLPLA